MEDIKPDSTYSTNLLSCTFAQMQEIASPSSPEDLNSSNNIFASFSKSSDEASFDPLSGLTVFATLPLGVENIDTEPPKDWSSRPSSCSAEPLGLCPIL